jgi:hypothetical protein
MQPPEGKIVDHINGEKNDNRKCNLRVCTYCENNMNTTVRKDNKSGTTGVFWENQSGKWKAEISYNKKRKHLGLFDKFEDAVNARKKAEVMYFGEYRRAREVKTIDIDYYSHDVSGLLD